MILSPFKISPLSKNWNFDLVASKCAYLFDGVNQDIVINNQEVDTLLTGSSKQLSFNFMVKRGATGSKQILFGSSDNSLALYFNASDNLVIETYDTAIVKSASTTNAFTNTTSDYYISFIYDGVTPTNSKILVNGVDETLSANTLTSTIDTTTNDYYLGSNGSVSYFNGELKQFSINNGLELLTEHQEWILNTKLPNSVFSNIVKLLNFDSDPSYDRVNSNFAQIDTVNQALTTKYFDYGTNIQKVIIDDNATLNTVTTGAAWTYHCMIKFKSLTSPRAIFSKETTTDKSWSIGTNTDQVRLVVYQSGAQKICRSSSGAIRQGEWMFCSFVFDGANSKVYVDGVDVTFFNNVTTTPDSSIAPYHFGLTAGWTQLLADFGWGQIVSKANTSTEITEIWNSGTPLNVNQTSFAANLIHTYNAEDAFWNGNRFDGTDSASGISYYSEASSREVDLKYGCRHISISQNLGEFDKKCNGVVSKGVQVDRVFWSGQSNSYGAENLSNLQAEYQGNRNDIQVWDNSPNYRKIDGLSSISFPLVVGGAFGAQFSFAYKWANDKKKWLFLDQYSVTNTRLNEEAGNDWNTNSVGEYYDLQETQNGLQDTYLANRNVNIVAEVWNQHENDCITEERANNYETNLTNYINARRGLYPNLKFVIVLVHTDLPIGSYPYKATVKQAQLNVSAALPNVLTIDQDSFASAVDNIHRNASGYEDLGNAIYNALK